MTAHTSLYFGTVQPAATGLQLVCCKPAEPARLRLQVTVIDASAMVIALAACVILPLAQLNHHKPADRLCKAPTLVLLFVMVVSLQCLNTICYVSLSTQYWFNGGNGTANSVSSCCCVALKYSKLCAKHDLCILLGVCQSRVGAAFPNVLHLQASELMQRCTTCRHLCLLAKPISYICA